MFDRMLDRELYDLGQFLVMLFEEAKGSQGLDAGSQLCSIGEFASSESVLVDGNSRVGGLSGIRGSFRMVVGLRKWSQYEAIGDC